MKNLIGFLILIKILVFLFLFNSADSILAQEKISEETEIYYTIDKEGTTSFKYVVILSTEPNFTTAVSRYKLSFPFQDLEFTSLKSAGKDLQAHKEAGAGVTQLELNLENRILNHSNPIYIEILGNVKKTLLRETEQTRILVLPGSISGLKATKVDISYPKSWGEISNFENEWMIQHDQDNINLKKFESGRVINLIWGQRIAYDFEINKKLSNSLSEPKKIFDLNVPKSQGNQKVFFSTINPIPNFSYQDAEGNLFFSYELDSGSELNINISGQIVIDFSSENKEEVSLFERPILTETTGYWLLDNEYELNRFRIFLLKEGVEGESVENMSPEMRENFYRLSYQYVVERLKLADVRTTSMESNIRQGANNALANKNSNAPEDFVDLLISIYRKYGVPTRMIEGYVLMLEHGFYHSWLEFWHEENGWQTADPALEAYSKGSFYKNQLYNHITILSRGYNYIRPRMIFFDSNEFVVNFADSITDENLSVENSIRINPLKKNEENIMGILTIKNTGNAIISMQKFLDQEKISFGNQNALQLVVPGQTIETPFIYQPDIKNKNEDIFLKYTSINGTEILNPITINTQEQTFWWWNPLITTLKFVVITIIVYITYLITNKLLLWIKKYYQ